MAESEELKSLLMKVKEENQKASLKLNIQKTQIIVSSPIMSLQIARENVQTVTDFIFLGSKITADGDCSHEIKRLLLFGRRVMTKLASLLKSRDITLPTKVRIVKAMGYLAVMYRCESWTVKYVDCQRLKLLNCGAGEDFRESFGWEGDQTSQILKEINPEYLLEGLMLKLKFQYFEHLMQTADSLEKTLMLGKIMASGRRSPRG